MIVKDAVARIVTNNSDHVPHGAKHRGLSVNINTHTETEAT